MSDDPSSTAPSEADWTALPRATDTAEAVEAHLARLLGEAPTVFHEVVSEVLHIDVHPIPPDVDRPWWTLFTTGMSALPMSPSPGRPGPLYAELVLFLPEDWQPAPDAQTWKDPENWWPVSFTKYLARIPHQYSTCLDWGSTVPNGDPMQPMAPDSAFTGVLLLPPFNALPDPKDWQVSLPDGRVIKLLAPVFLHPEEMDFKLAHGYPALLDRLAAAEVVAGLTPGRPSAV